MSTDLHLPILLGGSTVYHLGPDAIKVSRADRTWLCIAPHDGQTCIYRFPDHARYEDPLFRHPSQFSELTRKDVEDIIIKAKQFK